MKKATSAVQHVTKDTNENTVYLNIRDWSVTSNHNSCASFAQKLSNRKAI
ncbi:unnamed protein product [Acanthoscelides obtectus]|uniref:Uncharacterized protein n=1 Tax=Acanthoscelides obtectus TaxID=200917 RepID=A0A9P0JZD3_ACAOB|nr:unnamed protein product [Acanthoscelides obtectus]CAK1669731.1 hypothetical protein AOBTE_LOCUS27209 [Acanthoscelides obtectus]